MAIFRLACFTLGIVCAAVSAAPVPRELVDPKAVKLPPNSILVFVQDKWQIFRNREPLPRRSQDNTDRWVLRYYLAPLGAKTGRLVYKAEFAADLTDATTKDLAAESIGEHKSVPTYFASRDGLYVLVKGEYQVVGWTSKDKK